MGSSGLSNSRRSTTQSPVSAMLVPPLALPLSRGGVNVPVMSMAVTNLPKQSSSRDVKVNSTLPLATPPSLGKQTEKRSSSTTMPVTSKLVLPSTQILSALHVRGYPVADR